MWGLDRATAWRRRAITDITDITLTLAHRMATTGLIGSRVDFSSARVRGSVDRAFGVGDSGRDSAAALVADLALASAAAASRDVGLQAAGALLVDAASLAVRRGASAAARDFVAEREASMVAAGVASTAAVEAMAAAGDTGNPRVIRNALRLT